jgi:hypothetical protein
MTRTHGFLAVTALLLASGCSPAAPGYDEAALARYRKALPQKAMLHTVAAPQSAAPSNAVGDPAYFPSQTSGVAVAIDATIDGLIDSLGAITQLPPSAWDESMSQFLWGPYDDASTPLAGDTVLLYVKDEGPAASGFRYDYALARGMGNDLSTMKIVIWGAATPDPADASRGAGVTLWDYIASRAFEDAHDPGHAPVADGRFVAIYGSGADAANPGQVDTLVVSKFYQFVPGDQPGAAPANAEYFYGGFVGPVDRVDFADFAIHGDLAGSATTAPEDLSIDTVYFDGTLGRAAATIVGGDIASGTHVDAGECWDVSRNRLWLTEASVDDATQARTPIVPDEGAESSCAIDAAGMASVPTIASVDPNLISALESVAANGVPGS